MDFYFIKIIAILFLIFGVFLLIGSYLGFSRDANLGHAIARFLVSIIAFILAFLISKLAVRIKGVEEPAYDKNNIYSKKFPGKWADVFILIDKAGGVKKPDFKNLSRKERSRVGMNWGAFFLGPFYYLAMGMWRPMIGYFILMVMFFDGYVFRGNRLCCARIFR